MVRIGLQGRAITVCVVLVMGTAACISGALIWKSYDESLRRLDENALIHARALAHSAEPAVLLGDLEELQHLVGTTAANTAIELAYVTTPDLTVLARYERHQGFVSERDIHKPSAKAVGLDEDQADIDWSATQLHVVVPIIANRTSITLDLDDEPDPDRENAREGIVGYVALIHSLDSIRSEAAEMMLFTLLVAGAVVIVGVGATVVAVRRLLEPVHDLVETTCRITDGELTRRASDRAVGEIGVLARSFNHMADRLQSSYESIERTVEQRTAELVRANQAKSDFLANMSHEIRTPMTAILGYSEMLANSKFEPDEMMSAINTVHRNADHLLALIDDILDVTKIESGRFDVESIDCDVVGIVNDVETLVRAKATDKGLDLKVKYATDVPRVIQSDPMRLRQILLNLVGNAVKFTERGSITMSVSAQTVGDATNEWMLRFDIVDTGIGMSEDHREHVFEAFTQADETMSRRYGGTGLGLTISKNLARLLGGDLTLDSDLGVGSTFHVTVPSGPLTDVTMVRPTGSTCNQSAKPKEVSAPPQLDRRVLLAEDCADNQRLITLILEQSGISVVVAENGREAVGKATTSEFDIVLMDMQMPVMDGYEATRQLRRLGYTGPIVALTAHAMADDRRRCLDAGCTEFATKPINRKTLLKIIDDNTARPAAACHTDVT